MQVDQPTVEWAVRTFGIGVAFPAGVVWILAKAAAKVVAMIERWGSEREQVNREAQDRVATAAEKCMNHTAAILEEIRRERRP